MIEVADMTLFCFIFSAQAVWHSVHSCSGLKWDESCPVLASFWVQFG